MQNHSVIQPIIINRKSHTPCVGAWQLTFIRAGYLGPGEPHFWEVRPPEERTSRGRGVWSAQAVGAPAASSPGDAPSTGGPVGPRGPHRGLRNGPSEAVLQHFTPIGCREEFTKCG